MHSTQGATISVSSGYTNSLEGFSDPGALARVTTSGKSASPSVSERHSTAARSTTFSSDQCAHPRQRAALRALAFKWIRVLHRCWTDRIHYDESRYLLALQKRQAPLLKVAASLPS